MDNLKVFRVLNIFERLMSGEVINKKAEAERFEVNEKSIQRDIDDMRIYLINNSDRYMGMSIVYLRDKNGYKLTNYENTFLNKEEALAISKILLESRAFNKEEISRLIQVILKQVEGDERKQITNLIDNELFKFVPLTHNKPLLKILWDISEVIKDREIIKITYSKSNNKVVTRMIKPISIVFSEYYFYLIAYSEDKKFSDPTIFRIDRIENYEKTASKFYIPYSQRFEAGEFKKRVQFMYSGKLLKLKFEYYGASIDVILDKLPTANIVSKDNEKTIIEAEVFGKGIMMWLLSQGDKIKVLSPNELVDDIYNAALDVTKLYN